MKELQALAKELNEVLGCSPAIPIIGVTKAVLLKKIKEGAELIDPDQDEFTKKSMAKLVELELWPGEVPEEPEPEEPEEPEADNDDDPTGMDAEELEEEIQKFLAIKNAKTQLAKLKNLIAKDDTFKALRKKVATEFNSADLASKMLVILGADPVEETAAEDEKPKKEKKEKKEKKPKPPAYNRIDSVCEALKDEPGTMEEWIRGAADYMEANGGKVNDSESKFIIRYLLKMEKHFDFPEMPKA